MKKRKLINAEEVFRAELLRSATRLIPKAEEQARKGKPALFRTLCRLAGRGPKELRVREEEERPDLSGLRAAILKDEPEPS